MILHPDKQKALLALVVDGKEPMGSKPSLLEIDLWRCGKLAKKRAIEVASFIAHDSDCYQSWLDLLETEEELSTEQAKKSLPSGWSLREWWTNFNAGWVGGGLAFATASVLVAVVTLKTLIHPNLLSQIDSDYTQFNGTPLVANWYFPRNNKSLDMRIPSTYDLLKPAILTGLQKGLVSLQQSEKIPNNTTWNDLIASYPTSLPACPDNVSSEQCKQQIRLLQEFGRNLALMQLYCAQPTENTAVDFYNKQQQRLTLFKEKLSAYSDLAPLSHQLNTWQHSTDKSLFCTQVRQLSLHIMR